LYNSLSISTNANRLSKVSYLVFNFLNRFLRVVWSWYIFELWPFTVSFICSLKTSSKSSFNIKFTRRFWKILCRPSLIDFLKVDYTVVFLCKNNSDMEIKIFETARNGNKHTELNEFNISGKISEIHFMWLIFQCCQ